MSRVISQKDEKAMAALGGPLDGPPGEAEWPLQLLLHLSATSRTLRRRLADLAARVGLTEHELLAVWLCLTAGRAQSELATMLGISPAQMSGLVERLRGRGFIELQRPAQDRRRHIWRTSACGREVLAGTVPGLQELSRELVGQLSEEERRALLALSQRLAGQGGASSAPAASQSPVAISVSCPSPHAA
jgi:DNA-binding MarR family transcriptional regulator